MSFHVEVGTANHLIGYVAETHREDVRKIALDEDARRTFWSRHMLPLMSDGFFSSVVTSPEKQRHFTLQGLDPQDVPPRHIIKYESFAHLASNAIPIESILWQFRVILAEDVRAVLDTTFETEMQLRRDVFDKAGWEFWVTKTGFCVAPKLRVDRIKDVVLMYTAWIKTRDTDANLSPLPALKPLYHHPGDGDV
jgi:hypothetical protein